MTFETHEISRSTSAATDIVDLTDEVALRLEQSGIRNGQVVVFTPGSTASVSTIEYESGAVADLRAAVERLAPRRMHYDHDARWGDGNGYAHVRSALLGPSIAIPVIDGRMALGTWQQIILLDFDNRPRERRVLVQIHGE